MTRPDGGIVQRFAHGVIIWSAATGAHELHGAVATTWTAQDPDWALRWLGYPTSDGSTDVIFQRGEIVLNPAHNRAFMIGGAIWTKYRAIGGSRSVGLPRSNEANGRGGGVRRMSWFDRGAITWANDGTYVVRGGIYTAWTRVGSEKSYGRPLRDEAHSGATIDQQFSNLNATLVYRSGTVVPVSHGFGRLYLTRGRGAGDLGYPLSAEQHGAGAPTQEFLNAQTVWHGGHALIHVKSRISAHQTTVSETRYTYRSGCPVAPSQLTTTEMNYMGYDRRIHRGVMIVKSGPVTQRMQKAFTSAAWSAFPIYSMLNPDEFKGNDPLMIQKDNTSGFNCRKVTGSPYSVSPHSYGIALDVNDFENPYQDSNGTWWPVDDGRNGASYWRSHRASVANKGVLTGSDVMTRALVGQGAFWGARWFDKDYQHFQWDAYK